MTFKVTQDWIRSNTTNKRINGGINNAQCEVLGFKFKDLTKGWQQRLIGLELTLVQKEKFEELNGDNKKPKQTELEMIIADLEDVLTRLKKIQ